jgi:ribonuclease HII
MVADPMWFLEQQLLDQGCSLIAGIDEAGRGALAGPVVVAAVILPLDGLARAYRDSKTLSAARREVLAAEIKLEALAWAVELASSAEVDEFNVLGATKRAALRAVAKLEVMPNGLITDYLQLQTDLPLLAPAKADSSSYSVAAASILAKTTRDAYMTQLAQTYPEYGFAAHKGYGSSLHLAALQEYGVCLEHRRSFAPIMLLTDGLFSMSNQSHN